MLFLGTAKYPDEQEYANYLNKHGGIFLEPLFATSVLTSLPFAGHSNAFTSSEDTNYHFDVNPEFLEESLDRLELQHSIL